MGFFLLLLHSHNTMLFYTLLSFTHARKETCKMGEKRIILMRAYTSWFEECSRIPHTQSKQIKFIRKLEMLSLDSCLPLNFCNICKQQFEHLSAWFSDLIIYNAKIPQMITGFPFQLILLSTTKYFVKYFLGP